MCNIIIVHIIADEVNYVAISYIFYFWIAFVGKQNTSRSGTG